MRLIDADYLYDLIDGGFDIDFDETPETKRELLRMVKEAPTIDAEPVRYGKWIEDVIDKWRCSVCQKGDVYAFSWSISEGYELQDNYCPHCGARMLGGVNNGETEPEV